MSNVVYLPNVQADSELKKGRYTFPQLGNTLRGDGFVLLGQSPLTHSPSSLLPLHALQHLPAAKTCPSQTNTDLSASETLPDASGAEPEGLSQVLEQGNGSCIP